ncbi:hypothetical protein, partial [Paralimibaculum aggregatum]|uniref:hypothetical protein n=1 Tax=Paralimibaculum aggregatum TaxID=3036245 RepID=UPI002557B884
EDTSGLNRSILQDAGDGGETVEGLDITFFSTQPDFRDGDDAFEAGLEVTGQHLNDYIAGDNTAFLPEDDDSEAVSGNDGESRGQPTDV